MAGPAGMIEPRIFEDLQSRIDEDSAIRDVGAPATECARDSVLTARQELKDIIQALEKNSTRIEKYEKHC